MKNANYNYVETRKNIEEIAHELSVTMYELKYLANEIIDNSSSEEELAVGYAIRLLRIINDILGENCKELDETLKESLSYIKILYNNLNF